MTKKDYIKIADILAKKSAEVDKWNNAEAKSLTLAYIEDFIVMLQLDNPRFNRARFIEYISKQIKN